MQPHGAQQQVEGVDSANEHLGEVEDIDFSASCESPLGSFEFEFRGKVPKKGGERAVCEGVVTVGEAKRDEAGR